MTDSAERKAEGFLKGQMVKTVCETINQSSITLAIGIFKHLRSSIGDP